MYGDDKEKSIGASVALQVEKSMKLVNELDVNERVEKILNKIVAVCDRQDLVYTIRVIDEDEMNAFSLPGGYIYLNKGLTDRVTNDDQLAGVISHEVAHVVAKHAMKRLQGAYGATVLMGAALISGNGALAAGINLASTSLLFQNSREDEFESDRLGVKYMRLAGYDPTAMKLMLNALLEHQSKESLRPLNYWRTHPFLPQRMARAAAEARGTMEYRDYLNVTGEEK
jgi:predicted Zn-dependent protease